MKNSTYHTHSHDSWANLCIIKWKQLFYGKLFNTTMHNAFKEIPNVIDKNNNIKQNINTIIFVVYILTVLQIVQCSSIMLEMLRSIRFNTTINFTLPQAFSKFFGIIPTWSITWVRRFNSYVMSEFCLIERYPYFEKYRLFKTMHVMISCYGSKFTQKYIHTNKYFL